MQKTISEILFRKNVRISQMFGMNPAMYAEFGLKAHNGIDFATPVGKPIYACMDGEVTVSHQGKKGYGLHVRITNEKYQVVYGHLSEEFVSSTKSIKKGSLIGNTGNTGFSTGPHLHFGVRARKDNKISNYNNGYFGYFDPLTPSFFEYINKPVMTRVMLKPMKKRITFEQAIENARRVGFNYQGKGTNDCVPYSIATCAMMRMHYAVPDTIGKLVFDHNADETIRESIGWSREGVRRMNADYLVQELEKNGKSFVLDFHDYSAKLNESNFRELRNDFDLIQETYLSDGEPVIIGLSAKAYDSAGTWSDEANTYKPIKHNMCLFWVDDEWGYVLDTQTKTHIKGLPAGVKRIERSLLDKTSQGWKRGVDQIFFINPEVYKNEDA